MINKRVCLCLLGLVSMLACGQPPSNTDRAAQPIPPSVTTVGSDVSPAAATSTTIPGRVDVTAYQGRPLPRSTASVARVWPPPAWLLIGDHPVEGTLGSHGTVDQALTDEVLNTMATAILPPGRVAPRLIIGAGPLDRISVHMRPWKVESGEVQWLTPQPDPANTMVLTLPEIQVTADHLLHVFVRFGLEHGDDATYLWHLRTDTASPRPAP